MPINDCPDLRMHLRYRSGPGVLLNNFNPLIAHHCAFCHSVISTRAIRKHYSETHPQLLGYETNYRDQVRGLASLGSGPGICVFCNSTCRDARIHQCGVLFQVNLLMRQIYGS